MKIKKFNTYIKESISLDTSEIEKILNDNKLKFEINDNIIVVNGLEYNLNNYVNMQNLITEILSDNKII